jgi:hypothetical protein
MDLLKKVFAAGSLLAVGSAAWAAPVIPAGFENNTGDALTALHPDGTSAPGTQNTGLTFYLYDGVGETTYSLSYFTGLRMLDIQPDDWADAPAGYTLSWQIDTSSALQYIQTAGNTLRWGVTATDAGSINVFDAISLITTVNADAGSITGLTNGNIGSISNSFQNIIIGNNEVLGALDITTTPLALNDVLLRHTPIPDFTWTASAHDPSSTLQFWHYAQVGRLASANANPAAPTQLAGVWSFDLASGLLQYTLGGGSEVPLPAAVWLLLSGLGGMGIVSRRRRTAAA